MLLLAQVSAGRYGSRIGGSAEPLGKATISMFRRREGWDGRKPLAYAVRVYRVYLLRAVEGPNEKGCLGSFVEVEGISRLDGSAF